MADDDPLTPSVPGAALSEPSSPGGVDIAAIARRTQHAIEGQEEIERAGQLGEWVIGRAAAQAQVMTDAAEATLAEATAKSRQILDEAIGVLESATDDARHIRREASEEAARIRAEAAAVLRGALAEARAEREAVTAEALDRIARLTGRLMGMADELVAAADDPMVARAQLAQFILALTHAAERLDAQDQSI